MKKTFLSLIMSLACLGATSLSIVAQGAVTEEISFATLDANSVEPVSKQSAEVAYAVPSGTAAQSLASIITHIEPIPTTVRVRRNLAQATFCLPQNILGILFHGFLQASGLIRERAKMNEVTIVITRLPIGASLGRTLFLHTSLQTENAIRHEYGHTLQGYRRGPFFLLFEGAVSFAQAIVSVMSPTFADGYFERWPEDEASDLGGVH